MNVITLILIGIGAVGPLAVASAIIFFGSRGARGSPVIAIATLKGLALGALGGLLVCAAVIGLALGVRALAGGN